MPVGSPPTPSGWEVTTHGGRRGTGIDAVEWAAAAPTWEWGRSC
ncbi:putative imidazole glycerol phosphate synthase subunit hisF [Mycobacterium kansasii]|uniref:Putative imidazole glycerol phosphate synthase subunit hisF n=1 Tax=Mycobacterium kansasii TaxID=1768 RepID=A0A1V3XFJ3_MYCKA|nr:putative imidazole glycerol phosphate synthase subunit hisF [Mycobacterium kansasii]